MRRVLIAAIAGGALLIVVIAVGGLLSGSQTLVFSGEYFIDRAQYRHVRVGRTRRAVEARLDHKPGSPASELPKGTRFGPAPAGATCVYYAIGPPGPRVRLCYDARDRLVSKVRQLNAAA